MSSGPRKVFRKRQRDSDDEGGGAGAVQPPLAHRPVPPAAHRASSATVFSPSSAASGADAVRLAAAVVSDRSAAPHA